MVKIEKLKYGSLVKQRQKNKLVYGPKVMMRIWTLIMKHLTDVFLVVLFSNLTQKMKPYMYKF